MQLVNVHVHAQSEHPLGMIQGQRLINLNLLRILWCWQSKCVPRFNFPFIEFAFIKQSLNILICLSVASNSLVNVDD